MWLSYALAAAALYAISEVLDNFLVNKEFKHPFTLIFFTSLFNSIYVPVLYIFAHPTLPPVSTWPIFILLGFVSTGYLYPYYKGLRTDDTSVAISFLAIERMLVPVLAFLIVGEILQPVQYAGILVIMASVVLLGLHHSKSRFKFSKGVWYISCAALFLAVEAVLLKMIFNEGVSVATAVSGEAFVSFLFGMSVIFIPKVRRDIGRSVGLFIRLSPVFLIEELFTFIGLWMEGNAISRASVSVVKGVTMAAPFFLVVYAWLGSGLFPFIFKENLHRKHVLKKLALFAILIIGVILVHSS